MGGPGARAGPTRVATGRRARDSNEASNGTLSGGGALQRRAEPEPHRGARAQFLTALDAVRFNAPLDASDVKCARAVCAKSLKLRRILPLAADLERR